MQSAPSIIDDVNFVLVCFVLREEQLTALS